MYAMVCSSNAMVWDSMLCYVAALNVMLYAIVYVVKDVWADCTSEAINIKGFKLFTIIQDLCYGSQCFLKFKIFFYATSPIIHPIVYGFPFINLISCSL